MMSSVFIKIFGAFFERVSLAITSRLAFAFARELCCDVAPLVFLMLPRVVRRCCLPTGLSLSVTSFAHTSVEDGRGRGKRYWVVCSPRCVRDPIGPHTFL